MNELASIIILSYNRLQYFKDALDSVLNQTYPQIELVIADDCSDDFDILLNTYLGMPLEAYIDKHKKPAMKVVIIRNETNLCTVKNIKKAVDISTGNYIFAFGADDVLYDNDTVKECVEAMKIHGFDVFTGQLVRYSEDFKVFAGNFMSDLVYDLIIQNDRKVLLEKSLSEAIFANLMHTRALYDKLDFYNSPLFLIEDQYRNNVILKSDAKIGCTKKPLIKYRVASNSVQRSNNNNIKRMFELELMLTAKLTLEEQLYDLKENFINFAHRNKSKKLIIWGASGGLRRNYGFLKRRLGEISYIVDSDVQKQGAKFDGLSILPPEVLLAESNNEISVVVCNMFYDKGISKWLATNGFGQGENILNIGGAAFELIAPFVLNELVLTRDRVNK